MFRRHRYAVPAASKTAFRPSEEACPVSTTSGDPRNLNQFLEGSGPLRGSLTESARAAVKAIQAFAATGSVAGGSLGGLEAMIQLLADMGANEAFIHSITEALAAADRSGLGVVTISDATLAARLAADGVRAAPSYLTVGASSLMGFPPTAGFVGLMFVPGGQAIGAGILIGVALSGGVGIATGTFNPRMVAF